MIGLEEYKELVAKKGTRWLSPTSINDLYSVFFEPFRDYPHCKTNEAIILGCGSYTPSVVEPIAKLAVSKKIGFSLTIVGGNPVNNGGPLAAYLLQIQSLPEEEFPAKGVHESRYLMQHLHSAIEAQQDSPLKFDVYETYVDQTHTLREAAKLAINMINIPDYETAVTGSDESVAISLVTTPWMAPRAMATMREICDEAGRNYCFVPHVVWPTPRTYELGTPACLPTESAFINEYHKIGGSMPGYIIRGECKPLDIEAEKQRVLRHIQARPATDMRPRGFE